MSKLGIFDHFRSAPPADRESLERLGFDVIPIEPLSPQEEVMVYLDYRATGGEILPSWEAELRRLRKLGQLAQILADYENRSKPESAEE